MVHLVTDFRYWSKGLQHPLPEWGKFYLALGAAFAQVNRSDQRLVTALAVPTRSHAAVLTAAGVLMSRVKRVDENLNASTADHFEMLSGLPSGTSVIVRRGKKTDKGVLVGTRVSPSDETRREVGVRTESRKSGGLTIWMPDRDSMKVQVSSIAWTRLPTNSEKSRDSATSRSDFVSQIFQGTELLQFATKSTLDCVIIGNVGLLARETKGLKLSVGSTTRKESAGTLQDLLRVRRLFSKDESFRSEIFSASMANHAKLSRQVTTTPHVVIFDGAVAFLKWRDKWAETKWLVILDRTEPRFRDAVQVVNEEYLNRTNSEELRTARPTPSAVDLVAFSVTK